ncbi:MAG: hypothetical protein WD022_08255, partial [Balneolaceae bacterium]
LRRFRKHISLVFLAVTITGALLSVVHFHNSGFVYQGYDSEHHLVENDLLCPICAVIVYTVSDTDTPQSNIIELEESITEIDELLLSTQSYLNLPARAPPFMA